jgi:alkyl hydroperoxide reductase subunit F
MHDVIVIGAGPAGLAAAAYTLHHHLKTLVIAPDLAGKAAWRLQLPWLREREFITGEETVAELRQRLLDAPALTRYLDTVERVFIHNNDFHVITAEGGAASARAVIVATGVRPRPLGVPGEQRLLGYGLSYSATSHAPLFAGRSVVVVGNDLRTLRAAAELRHIAASLTLIAPGPDGLGGYTLGQQLLHDQRVTVLANASVVEITGDSYVTGVVVAGPDGQTQTIPAEGVFVENGLLTHTDFLGGLVERTSGGQLVVDERCATRSAGMFAAGDISSTAHAEQILIALGEGAKAGLSACAYLLEGPDRLDEKVYNEGDIQ